MSVNFKDNSKKVLTQFEKNKLKALTAIGQLGVEITTNNMLTGYGRPIWVTGDLLRSIAFNVDMSKSTVTIGSNLDYSVKIHEGTGRMIGRPYLKDAIIGHEDKYEDVAKQNLGKDIELTFGTSV